MRLISGAYEVILQQGYRQTLYVVISPQTGGLQDLVDLAKPDRR
jgi:hypothetical protein